MILLLQKAELRHALHIFFLFFQNASPPPSMSAWQSHTHFSNAYLNSSPPSQFFQADFALNVLTSFRLCMIYVTEWFCLPSSFLRTRPCLLSFQPPTPKYVCYLYMVIFLCHLILPTWSSNLFLLQFSSLTLFLSQTFSYDY